MKKITIAFILVLMTVLFITCDSSKTADKNISGQIDINGSAVSSDLINTILASYSQRSFKEGVVPPDAIETILNCAQKAPSAGNGQPWHFTVITNNEIARQTAPRHYVEGSAVIVISGKADERRGVSIAFDTALASQNIYLASQALGFGTRQYYTGVQAVNDSQKEALGIPDDYAAQIIMLIGFIADDVDAVTSASPRRSFSENVNYIK